MSDDLLSCPCCGGDAYFDEVPVSQFELEGQPSNAGGQFVECSKCGLSTTLMFPLMDDVKGELAEKWNRRAHLAQPGMYELMATSGHYIGVFKDGKLTAADEQVYAQPEAAEPVIPKHIAAHKFVDNGRNECAICGDAWLDTRHILVDPQPAKVEPTAEPLYVVFDGPPAPESGRFVEVENAAGYGRSVGEWKQRHDGLWTLGPLYAAPVAAQRAEGAVAEIDVVFDGPPGHESGRFVEVEDVSGKSISVGRWLQRTDGYWVLRMRPAPASGLASDEVDRVRDELRAIFEAGESSGVAYEHGDSLTQSEKKREATEIIEGILTILRGQP